MGTVPYEASGNCNTELRLAIGVETINLRYSKGQGRFEDVRKKKGNALLFWQ